MAKLSVIIATVGRPTLARALKSITLQYMAGDEVIVVSDGHECHPRVRDMVDVAQAAGRSGLDMHCFRGRRTEKWGHAQRQLGMEMAEGSHIAFLDDDDIWAPHARASIDRVTGHSPDAPIMFRMLTPQGLMLWRDPVVKMGNVGTPMIVVPNRQDMLGRWGDRYEGDYDFMTSLKWPAREMVWSTDLACLCRPTEPYWMDKYSG